MSNQQNILGPKCGNSNVPMNDCMWKKMSISFIFRSPENPQSPKIIIIILGQIQDIHYQAPSPLNVIHMADLQRFCSNMLL